jgi:hypothetical protein
MGAAEQLMRGVKNWDADRIGPQSGTLKWTEPTPAYADHPIANPDNILSGGRARQTLPWSLAMRDESPAAFGQQGSVVPLKHERAVCQLLRLFLYCQS